MEYIKIAKIPDILEIVDVNFMQNVQDFFADSMNIALQSFCGQEPLTTPSNFIDFCSKCVLTTEIGCQRCKSDLYKELEAAYRKKKPFIFKCHAHLANFAIPVLINGTYVASVLGGKVLTEPPNKHRFRKIAREIGIDEDEFMEKAEKIRIISYEKFQAIAESLSLIVNAVAAIAYANFQLSELGIGYKIPRTIDIKEWLFLNCENIKSPLTAREFDVLKLIILGKSNTQIAKELFISVHTAKAHVSSILEKFLVEDRVQMAVKAVREGII